MISVIVPNYNYAPYLPKRLDSILGQTYRDIEVILLDDASTDNSVEVMQQYCTRDGRIRHLLVNERNSGCVFKQWEKGLQLAQGELIWIAESDDWAEPTLLEELVKGFEAQKDTVLAYTTSVIEDETGKLWGESKPGTTRYFGGNDYIKRYLSFTNTIANASSALFSKAAGRKAIEGCSDYRSAGDTYFWIRVCQQGKVTEIRKGLNHFMRHSGTVTSGRVMDGTTYLEERRIHDYLRQNGLMSGWRDRCIHFDHLHHILYTNFSDGEARQRVLAAWEVGRYHTPLNLLLYSFYMAFKKKNLYF